MTMLSIIIAVNEVDEKFWASIRCLEQQDFTWHECEVIIEANAKNCDKHDFDNSFLLLNAVVSVRHDHGIYDAFNHGLSVAKGEFIWFLGAGDILPLSSTLKYVCETLKRYETDNTLCIFRVGREQFGTSGTTDIFGRLKMDHHQGMVASKNLFDHHKFSTEFMIAGDLDWFSKIVDIADFQFYDNCICEIDKTGVSKDITKRHVLRKEILKVQLCYAPSWKLIAWYFLASIKGTILRR